MGVSLLFYSMPEFWLGMLLILGFAVAGFVAGFWLVYRNRLASMR